VAVYENKIDNFNSILHLLSDGEFHSGSALGKILGLTRTTIWKLIQQFPNWDIDVESVTGKGYRIPGGLSLLNKETIQQGIASLPNQPTLEIVDSISSTQDYLMEKQFQLSDHRPFCCLAERQTKGRGRQGRTWISPFARNIYLSLLWHFPRDLSELYGLSLVTAIAVLQALHSMGATNIGVKWPNDILWKEHQKLSGILIEMSGETHHVSRAIIGIGINVCMPKTLGEPINQSWVDLFQILNVPQDRNQLTIVLLKTLTHALTTFQTQGFAPFKKQWEQFDLTFGKKITLSLSNQTLSGIGRGINEQGLFRVELPTGEIKCFASGEVSLRIT
jgi:BirA family biotin operon repressor/biotin-[acetyl-CoA-carboxylase] ligase